MGFRTLIAALTITLICSGAVVIEQAEAAKRGKTPVMMQATFNTEGDIQDPRVRSERAETVAFTSTGDVEGPGSATGGREVYLWHAPRHPLSPYIVERVTNSGIGKESYNASRATDETFNSGRPQFLAFVSTADLDPATGNADGNPEIFLWELLTGTYHQLTDTLAPVVNDDPYPTDSGKSIVFSSTGDLTDYDGSDDQVPATGFTNPDGSQEIFMYNLTSSEDFPSNGFFYQVSNGPAGTTSARPVIGGYWFPRQSQSTAYMSDFDQTAEGVTGTHIYMFHRPSARLELMHAQEIPQGLAPGNYFKPHISSASNFARGPFVVFQTDADVWANDSSGFNMFRYRVFHPRMTQYTDQVIGDVKAPVVSDGGAWIAMHSDGELLVQNRTAKFGGDPPFNSDQNDEIFRTKGRRKVQQITQTENCENTQPSIEDTGVSIAFRSTCDLVGLNPNNVPQVFFYTQVKKEDPLINATGCSLAAGCCNEANNCFKRIEGRMPKATKKNCLLKSRGCD